MTILIEITLYYRRHSAQMTSDFTQRKKRDFNGAPILSLQRRKKAGRTVPFTPFAEMVRK